MGWGSLFPFGIPGICLFAWLEVASIAPIKAHLRITGIYIEAVRPSGSGWFHFFQRLRFSCDTAVRAHLVYVDLTCRFSVDFAVVCFGD